MKKKALFLLPFLVLGLSGCNDVDDEDVSFAPGTVIPDPEQHTGDGHPEDYTTEDTEGGVITGIESVVSSPATFDPIGGIDAEDVMLRLTLDNGNKKDARASSLEYDAEGKTEGQSVTITAKYAASSGVFETTFESDVHFTSDVINNTTMGVSGTSYSTYNFSSSTVDAQYEAQVKKNSTSFSLHNKLQNNKQSAIISTHSGGRIKKIIIETDTDKTTSDKAAIWVFAQTTPYSGLKDITDYDKSKAILELDKTTLGSKFETKFDKDQNFNFIAIANGSGSNGAIITLKSVTIAWDETKPAPALQSMAFENGSYVKAEPSGANWDFSGAKVKGTFEGGVEADVTNLVDFSSTLSPIPAEADHEATVPSKATYQRDNSISTPITDLPGEILTNAAKWDYSISKSAAQAGGTLSTNCKDGDFFYQDNSSSETYYVQILSDSPYWTTAPQYIKFYAKLGGGSKTLPSGSEMKVALLDSSGEIIGSPETVTSTISTKNGSEFTVAVAPVANVYGVKLYHLKANSYNVLFYSMSLGYEA